MSKIFISYRRDDTEGHAGRLYDRLVREFGDDRVFMDTAEIPAGADFEAVIEREIQRAFAMLVLIGPRWSAPGADGRSRLFAPNDYVRYEIRRGLERGIGIIPVLLQGARMPRAGGEELARGTADLARRNAIELRHHAFDEDFRRLVARLREIEAEAAPREGPTAPAPPA